MATVKQREKRRQARLRKNRREELKAQEDILIPDDEEIEDEESTEEEDFETEEERAPVKKEYYAEPSFVLPTSYEEMDAAKKAREQAEAVRQETYTVQDLVSNIAYSPMTPDEKGKAIVKVGKDFGTRLKSITDGKMTKEFVDMDVLQLQALIAKDARQTSLIEKAGDFLATAFKSTQLDSKTFIRKQLRDVSELLTKNSDDSIRSEVAELLKKAKEAGIGSSSILIEKDASGSWRAVMYPTNNFKDRDGEILSDAAHLEYVEWVNKNMDCAPVFCTWHQAGTARTHPMDFIGYDNGIMIASLPLTEQEASCILKMQAQMDIGLSIGGIALERDQTDKRIITKYRMFEVSDLPLDRAANPFTEIELISKEAQMDAKKMKDYLAGMIGDAERADKIVEKMALTQAELRKAGVEEKEVKTSESETTVVAKEAPAVNLDELVERLSKELGMKELSDTIASLMETAEKVPALEALVKELSASSEEKLAELIQPKIQKSLSWMKERPSQRDDTILKEGDGKDDELKKSVPTVGWFTEATGIEPVKV